MAWSGMRGAISLAVALAHTTDAGGGFPGRDLIVFLTFCRVREGNPNVTGQPKYGFHYNENKDVLIVHAPEMRVVEMIFRLAAEGLGLSAIQGRLYAARIPTRTGKRRRGPSRGGRRKIGSRLPFLRTCPVSSSNEHAPLRAAPEPE
jgi:hypothetical protein